MKNFVVNFFFNFYKASSILLGSGACRHVPSCSEYARQAFIKHSPSYALFLSLKRLLKCNPLFKGGYDPVP